MDRIVSKPHVRPIPRGKTKAQIEFGPKLGVSFDQGFARINTFSWDAYHESGDLIPQVEAYKELHGHYPGQAKGYFRKLGGMYLFRNEPDTL